MPDTAPPRCAAGTILFLTHRLPYAPNRGDRLRAYYELRALAARYEVHLLSLVHDEEERSHAEDLKDVAASVTVALVAKVRALMRALVTLATRRPLTHALLDSPAFRPALATLLRRTTPDVVLAFCSGMARFALEPPLARVPFILDMVDVDSAKWRALAATGRRPLKWVYARESVVLARFEARATRQAGVTFVVNEREAATLRALSGCDARVEIMENGVDLHRLQPPAPPGPSTDVVFCGVMNYAPNEEGALWLAKNVWPSVVAARPDARLVLVGANPTSRLRALEASNRSIVVTGSVPDVRPYLWNAAVSVAPLLLARGVQSKVLESVGAGLPAVVTRVVADGLPPEVMPACQVAESSEAFAAAIVEGLAFTPQQRRAAAQSARLERIGWERRLAPLLDHVGRLVQKRG